MLTNYHKQTWRGKVFFWATLPLAIVIVSAMAVKDHFNRE